jgi:NAD(P)-dependent dehydrogenase (short-subunit alcohol dehydrogenase family)
MAEPGDIAGVVVSVAGDEAGWITGQSILVNGGNAFSI